MKTKTITIRSTAGYVVEKIDKKLLEESIFSDQYKAAIGAIENFLAVSKKQKENGSDEPTDNMFGFIGDRGSGKTSCMLSVRNVLCVSEKECLAPSNIKNIEKTNFLNLELIDPSFFDSKNNIVGLFIAQLYKDFEKKESNLTSSSQQNAMQRNALYEAFQKAQTNYKYLLGDAEKCYDELEDLTQLSAAVDLRRSLLELVEAYTQYMGVPGGYILISIDDVDLHSDSATAMAEHIRKYLSINNVIVLLSLKLSQLTILKKQQYVNEYATALRKGLVSLTAVEDMAENYITKFLPYSHRIFMPNGDVFGNWMMKFENGANGRLVSQYIPELIFKKTRYLFYNSSVQTNYIVPVNLRELCYLAILLHGMHSYREEKDKEGNEIRYEYNKTLFRKYLTETWLPNHLSHHNVLQIQPLLGVSETIQFNAIALNVINKHFPKFVDDIENTGTDVIKYLRNSSNQTYNISMGDVIGLINKIEAATTNREDLYFIFFIKTLYSMRMYETYDVLTDEIKEEEVKGKEEKDKSVLILKNDPLGGKGVSEYHRFVGGNFLSCEFWNALPPKQNGDIKARSIRPISIKNLNKLVKECVDNWDKTEYWKIRLAEFFMLCTSRPFDSKMRRKSLNT